MNSDLSYNLDEIDDHVSLKKLEALDEVISREIGKLTEKKINAERITKKTHQSYQIKKKTTNMMKYGIK